LGIGILLLIGVLFFTTAYLLGLLTGGKAAFPMAGRVGVVRVEGMITGAEEITEQLDEFAEDDSVKAIVVRIDSPGGGVAPSQEVYQAIRRLRAQKRVVASMGSVAASGGYLIATAAEQILANPGTITGSISAVMHFADVQQLMQKVGVRSSVVKSGKFKDIGTPVRSMTEEERQLVQGIVDDIYDQFLQTVAENRRIPRETLTGLADGRIFTGRQAHELKLVDQLGGLWEAVELAGKLAGIEGKPAMVYAVRKKTSIWKYLLENAAAAVDTEIRRQAGSGEVKYLLQ
jgi:protease-4